MKIIKPNPILTINSEDSDETNYKSLPKWIFPNKQYEVIGYIYDCLVVKMEINDYNSKELFLYESEIDKKVRGMFKYNKDKYETFLLNISHLNIVKAEEIIKYFKDENNRNKYKI